MENEAATPCTADCFEGFNGHEHRPVETKDVPMLRNAEGLTYRPTAYPHLTLQIDRLKLEGVNQRAALRAALDVLREVKSDEADEGPGWPELDYAIELIVAVLKGGAQ